MLLRRLYHAVDAKRALKAPAATMPASIPSPADTPPAVSELPAWDSVATLLPSDEPPYARMRAGVNCPGPESLRLMAEQLRASGVNTTQFVVDYSRSSGNYVVDADGNTLLDVFNNIASTALGYNSPVLARAATDPRFVSALVNRPALGVTPSLTWADSLQRGFLRAAPPGFDKVWVAMCGSCAVETAMKAVFMWYRKRQRAATGNTANEFSPEELSSCMANQAPGTPNLALLSFSGSFHGRTPGALSATRSKALHKIDIPALPWPSTPFPELKYPLDKFEAENRAEEERCLAEVERMIVESHKGAGVGTGSSAVPEIAGVIVEPIQSEGGDRHASPHFFRELRRITREQGVAFVVDEVQTGVGATGTFWAHEQWDLAPGDGPDLVTFAKKFQAAGYFYTEEFTPDRPYRQYNTWMGHEVTSMLAAAMVEAVQTTRVLQNAVDVGAILKEGLARHDDRVLNLRGVGTYVAFERDTPKQRDNLIKVLREEGVHAGGCGDRTVRLRPSLVFGPRHAEEFLRSFDRALAKLA